MCSLSTMTHTRCQAESQHHMDPSTIRWCVLIPIESFSQIFSRPPKYILENHRPLLFHVVSLPRTYISASSSRSQIDRAKNTTDYTTHLHSTLVHFYLPPAPSTTTNHQSTLIRALRTRWLNAVPAVSGRKIASDTLVILS